MEKKTKNEEIRTYKNNATPLPEDNLYRTAL
jgi:hypothetical protein